MSEHAKNSMMVDLRIGTWTARKMDKSVAKEVAKNHQASDNSGSYYKSLLSSPELAEVNRLVSAARNCHYRYTLPWSDSGPRVLPVKLYFEYSKEIADYRLAFNQAVDAFVAQYPAQRAAAAQYLGSMYDGNDYPPVDVVRGKFYFGINFAPVPVGSDFRCQIGEAQVQEIAAEIEKNTHDAMSSAVRSLYGRIEKVVQAFVDRLGKDDAVFRDTLVDNARELVDMLPKLNVTNDPEINLLAERIEKCLCTYDPNSLRKNYALREEVYKDAKTISEDLAGFFGGGN